MSIKQLQHFGKTINNTKTISLIFHLHRSTAQSLLRTLQWERNILLDNVRQQYKHILGTISKFIKVTGSWRVQQKLFKTTKYWLETINTWHQLQAVYSWRERTEDIMENLMINDKRSNPVHTNSEQHQLHPKHSLLKKLESLLFWEVATPGIIRDHQNVVCIHGTIFPVRNAPSISRRCGESTSNLPDFFYKIDTFSNFDVDSTSIDISFLTGLLQLWNSGKIWQKVCHKMDYCIHIIFAVMKF